MPEYPINTNYNNQLKTFPIFYVFHQMNIHLHYLIHFVSFYKEQQQQQQSLCFKD